MYHYLINVVNCQPGYCKRTYCGSQKSRLVGIGLLWLQALMQSDYFDWVQVAHSQPLCYFMPASSFKLLMCRNHIWLSQFEPVVLLEECFLSGKPILNLVELDNMPSILHSWSACDCTARSWPTSWVGTDKQQRNAWSFVRTHSRFATWLKSWVWNSKVGYY